MHVVQIPPDYIEVCWPLVEKWLAKAAKLSNEFTIEDLKDFASKGQVILFSVVRILSVH
jgi:hypothetical protein